MQNFFFFLTLKLAALEGIRRMINAVFFSIGNRRCFWACWRDFFRLCSCPPEKSLCLFVCLCVLAVLDRSLVASCKDSIGWMFSKLDTNSDLYLDQAELAAINLDKYEVCIRPFFNSCDSYRDGKVSTAEWCLCFWRESECSGDYVRFAGLWVRTHLSVCWHFPFWHMQSNFKALGCPRGAAASVLCAGPSVFVFLLILQSPYGPKRSPQGTKNISAACWQPDSPTALGDWACQPSSWAETRSQDCAVIYLGRKGPKIHGL